MSKSFGDKGKEKLPFNGRRLRQNQAQGGTAICRDRVSGGRQETKTWIYRQ